MKKTSLIITAAMLILCMTGCSENGTKTTTTTTTAEAAPAASVTTTAKAELKLPDERLFGGYVSSNEPAEMRSEPSESGELIVKIPSATQIDIFDGGKEGWYMTRYDEKIGYIKAECVAEVEKYDDDMDAEHLFRGQYVPADASVGYLMSRPDDNSEKVEELTYGTIMEIYSCKTDGWYKAVVGGDLTGYVRKDNIEEMPHTLPFGERLFGGYIAQDEAVNLYSEADESSEVVRSIPGWTQLDIYESDAEGWYMTAIANADGTHDIGYIKADKIAEIPAYDMDNVSVADIVGLWVFQQQDATVTDSYVGKDLGYIEISADSTYKYTSGEALVESGTIAVVYEEFENGQRVPWFVFYDRNGDIYMGCSTVSDDGCLYVGNSGEQRLVRDNGNAVGGTDNYSVPNEYGFYELKNPPASGVSIAALEGTWTNAANAEEKLVITRDEDIYKGTFTFGSVKGNIKLEFLLNPDNTQTFWYTFYSEDGKLWNAFSVSGDIPLTDIYSGQDGALHFTRNDA